MVFEFPQYEYKDKIFLSEGDIFLDCGSCAGEVSIWAQKKVTNGSEGKVYAFEPSPRVYELLKRNCARFAPNVLTFHCAIGGKSGTIQFSDDGAPWSRVAASSSLTVPMKCLDDFCEEFSVKPSLIKMDIEGYELLGLQGAARTIREHKPDLAICTYHVPAHIWEVGNMIQSICGEYIFYFKKHHPVWEGVLYATIR